MPEIADEEEKSNLASLYEEDSAHSKSRTGDYRAGIKALSLIYHNLKHKAKIYLSYISSRSLICVW